MIVGGISYILLTGERLHPSRADIMVEFRSRPREYLLEAQIRKGSSLAGKSVDEAGFAGGGDTAYTLVEIVRDGST